MTSRELIRWSTLHERRGRAWWGSATVVTLGVGAATAAWVGTRAVGPGGSVELASHAWLAAAFVSFAFAFLRVPFLLYWRHDAAFLAQLPIEGGPLYDAALYRCARAAGATTIAVIIGAVPLALVDGGGGALFVRHAVFAGTLGIAAGALLPAVATYAASLVATSQGAHKVTLVKTISGAERPRTGTASASTPPPPPPTTVLGALPGFMSTTILTILALASPWLLGHKASLEPALALGGIAAAGIAGIAVARVSAPRFMAKVLRDVSALDRQRLASLEIRPPTGIERAIASVLGDAALPYSKDARLMRRRYPMAFALGALAFLVLAIVGLARPADAAPWLAIPLAGSALYAVALASRLRRAPIELTRLSASLPISASALARAKHAWLAGWIVIFVAIPAVFAILRLT